MRKFCFRLILTITVVIFSLNSSAQFFLGSHLNYTQYIDFNTIGNGNQIGYAGIGLTGEFGMGGNSIKAAFNLGGPYKFERPYDLQVISTASYDTTISGFERYNFFSFSLDYKYFLFEGDAEVGGFYFFAGGGLTIATITHHPDDYDETVFETTFDHTEKSRIFQPIIRGGVGYEHAFNFGNIYLEPFFNLPANQLFGVTFSVNLPLSIGLQAGIKIPIG